MKAFVVAFILPLSLATVANAKNGPKSSGGQCSREAQNAAFKAVLEDMNDHFEDLTGVSLEEKGTYLVKKTGDQNLVSVSILVTNKNGSQVEQVQVEATETPDNACIVNESAIVGAD